MTKHLNLTWAIAVDSASLGARLEALLETRAIEPVLSICAKKPGTPIPADFPPKLLERIASAATDATYRSKIRDWQTAVQCIRGDCWSMQEAYDGKSHGVNPGHYDKETFWCYRKGYPNAIETRIQNVHKRNVVLHLKKLARFGKCRGSINRLLNVSPDFSLLKASRYCNTTSDSDDDGQKIESSKGPKFRIPTPFSYLTLPVTSISLKHEKGPDQVSYAMAQTIHPSSLEPLTETKRALFESAVETLNLNAAHSNVMVDDKSEEDEWPFWGSGSEGSDDNEGEGHLRSKKRAKEQHLECLECKAEVCKGDSPLASVEPKLMLLGYGRMESYDGGYS